MEGNTEFEVVPASSQVREDSSKESGNLIAAAVAFLGWAFSERRLPRASWSTEKLDCVLEESGQWCETFGGIGGSHVSATNIRHGFGRVGSGRVRSGARLGCSTEDVGGTCRDVWVEVGAGVRCIWSVILYPLLSLQSPAPINLRLIDLIIFMRFSSLRSCDRLSSKFFNNGVGKHSLLR